MSRQSGSSTPLRLGLPKGRMEQGVLTLLADAGIRIRPGARGYRPDVSLPDTEAKILKPQNIVEMLALGSRDLGFAGADWVAELEANVVELLDTGLDPVQVVAAAHRRPPDAARLRARGQAPGDARGERLGGVPRGGGRGAAIDAASHGGAAVRQRRVRGEGRRAARRAPASDPRGESGRRHRPRRVHILADRPMSAAPRTAAPPIGPVSRIDPATAYRRPASVPGMLRLDSNEGVLPS